MTINDLIELAGGHPWALVLLLGPLPVLAFALGRIAGRDRAREPWTYLYAALVYAACVPGIFACVLVGYSLFFMQADLLQVNLLVYGLPVVVMALTLAIIRRDVAFARIPGFDRLTGLIVLLAVSFIVALFMVKARVWLLFGSSMTTLAVTALAAFLVLRWAGRKLFQ